MNEIAILQNLAVKNRSSYQAKQVEQEKKASRIKEAIGSILAYDGVTSRYQVQDKLGNIHLARAISNSAALALGSQVSLCFSQGGVPVIDAMPR